MSHNLTPFEVYFADQLAALFGSLDPDYRAELQTLVDLDPSLSGMRWKPHAMGGFEIWWAGRPIGGIAPFPDSAEVA